MLGIDVLKYEIDMCVLFLHCDRKSTADLVVDDRELFIRRTGNFLPNFYENMKILRISINYFLHKQKTWCLCRRRGQLGGGGGAAASNMGKRSSSS